MTQAQRLEFAARHFNDLQTIRFAPVPVAMMLAPALRALPHVSRTEAWVGLLAFLAITAGLFWWTTAAIRRRYGNVEEMRDEARRRRSHPVLLLLCLALALYAIVPHKPWPWSDVYLVYTALLLMLITILDATNPASRRIAWAIGFVILFGAGPFLVHVNGAAVLWPLAGAIWLALSTFDFLLLRRILEATPPSPTSITDAVRHV